MRIQLPFVVIIVAVTFLAGLTIGHVGGMAQAKDEARVAPVGMPITDTDVYVYDQTRGYTHAE